MAKLSSAFDKSRGLFDPSQPGFTSTSSMTDMEREELRRLATNMEAEKEPHKILAVAQEMNELLERILSRVPKQTKG